MSTNQFAIKLLLPLNNPQFNFRQSSAMGTKLILLMTAVIALFSCQVEGQFSSYSRMGPREMEQMVKTIDPNTCRCSYPDQCQITIPDVSMIGIRCQPTTQFCCRARAIIKPFLNSNDWAELFAAVKRLKVEQQVNF